MHLPTAGDFVQLDGYFIVNLYVTSVQVCMPLLRVLLVEDEDVVIVVDVPTAAQTSEGLSLLAMNIDSANIRTPKTKNELLLQFAVVV